MHDDDEEYNGLLDGDPALDCILFEEMRKEDVTQKKRGGCLGILLFFYSLFFIWQYTWRAPN